MPAFDEILFDSAIMTAAAGSPEFANTLIRNPATGIYKVNINRYDPINVWNLELDLLKASELDYVNRFWRGGFGSAYGFRVRIPSDWMAVSEVIGTGDGVKTVFPLYKTYSRPGVSSHSNVRRIVKPVAITNLTSGSVTLYEADGVTARVVPHAAPPGIGLSFQVFLNSVNQVSGWTVKNTTGEITFATPPAAGVVVSWSGEFDTPARFLQNGFQQDVDVTSRVQGLSLCEILPAELGIT